jgi:glucose/arabinose dehydrogenase
MAATVVASMATHTTVGHGFDSHAPAAKRTPDPSQVSVALELVVTGFQRPVAVRNAGDSSSRLFIVEQPGRIRIVDGHELRATPFLDISTRVRDSSNEQGLLGLAFHRDYDSNGRIFVNYTDLRGDTVVAEFTRSGEDPDRADPASEAIIITIEQPRSNHNGGDIAFGPDGYLWIAAGDGGGAGDPDGNGQNRETLLGKLLRIDVDSGSTYTIPPDNPFIDNPGAKNEIWAFGLRNPWRFSFDRVTGDLFIGDVGQGMWEEIDFEARLDPGGRNYGWSRLEGNQCCQNDTCSTNGLTPPIAEYSHQSGCSVTGGYAAAGQSGRSLPRTRMVGPPRSSATRARGFRASERMRTANSTSPMSAPESCTWSPANPQQPIRVGRRGALLRVQDNHQLSAIGHQLIASRRNRPVHSRCPG